MSDAATPPARSLVIACGLIAEAKIAAGDGSIVFAGGGDAAKLEANLEAAADRAMGLLSFGVAGGLAPALRPGAVCIANAIVAPSGDATDTDPNWTRMLETRLGVRSTLFAGVDTPLADIAGKASLYQRTGAAVVDMESHLVAKMARRRGLKFAAIRVVTDPADRALPHAASVGMRADGEVDLPAILISLAKKPGQLPGLIRTGLDARLAFAALLRCRQVLGPGFALFDL